MSNFVYIWRAGAVYKVRHVDPAVVLGELSYARHAHAPRRSGRCIIYNRKGSPMRSGPFLVYWVFLLQHGGYRFSACIGKRGCIVRMLFHERDEQYGGADAADDVCGGSRPYDAVGRVNAVEYEHERYVKHALAQEREYERF